MYFPLRKYMTGGRAASLPGQRPSEPGRDAAVASGDAGRYLRALRAVASRRPLTRPITARLARVEAPYRDFGLIDAV
jgi:hypothetical protein